LHLFHQFRRARHLVVFVITGRPRLNGVVVKQFLCLARVLAGNHFYFFQDAQSAQGNVLQVSDGRADQVECWFKVRGNLRSAFNLLARPIGIFNVEVRVPHWPKSITGVSAFGLAPPSRARQSLSSGEFPCSPTTFASPRCRKLYAGLKTISRCWTCA